MKLKTFLVIALAALALPVLASAQGAPRYAVVKTVRLGAPDRWDYVQYDPPSHRVYVAHGDRVTVIDGRSGAILGQVTGVPGGTHGIAVAHSAGRGYTDDGRAGEVKVFDLKSLRVIKTLRALPDADGALFDRISGHVFVADGDSGKITVVDPQMDKVIGTIDAGGGLEFLVSGDNGKIYVNGAQRREILRMDVRTNQIDARWSVPNCQSPHGLAIDTTVHRLFSSCLNDKLVVIDTDRGTVVATLPIGKGTDAAAFDPKRKLVFSSNGTDGDLTVIHEDTPNSYRVVATIKTAPSARTMALDPQTGRIYLVAADLEPISPAIGRRKIVPGSAKLLFLDPGP